MEQWKIHKFGGTSVASAERYRADFKLWGGVIRDAGIKLE